MHATRIHFSSIVYQVSCRLQLDSNDFHSRDYVDFLTVNTSILSTIIFLSRTRLYKSHVIANQIETAPNRPPGYARNNNQNSGIECYSCPSGT